MQALTANVQELARQSAADRREIQELTKQNQELIALLRSRGEIPNPGQGQNGGEGLRNEEGRNQNQDQNNEGSSANQNRVPYPSQVADPTRSTTDARAAKLEEELKEMMEQMKEMKSQVKAKAAKNLDMLVHRTKSPFTKRVDEYPLPTKFKVPQLETFDGFKDPFDYLDSFRTVMRLQGVSDEIMCRAFPTNLRGSARTWFNQLETGSIDTFAQLSRAFIDNFIGGRRSARPTNYLLNIRKKRKESEDRRYESSKSRFSKQDYPKGDKKNVGSSSRREERSKGFTPLNMSIDQVLLQIQDDPEIKWPGKLRSNLMKRFKDLYCRFHRDYGHTTEDCYALKEQIEALIRQGKLRKFVRRDTKKLVPSLVLLDRRRIRTAQKTVHNILITQRPQKNVKMNDQVISFSEDDARGIHQLHDDALVVIMTIARFITRRVLIDNGSSANIIYLPAYQQMKIDKEWLRPIDIPLMGFTGDKVRPTRVVSLIIEAGTYLRQVRTSVEFLVVDCPSAYNVIIGRPTLNKLKAVTSTYHLFVCFPTEHYVGELKRDQATARECYFASLGLETKHQTMKIDESQRLVEPTEELEVVSLDDEKPHRITSIATKMDGRLKESMMKFLKDNLDVFAWTHEDMPIIDLSAICHRLNVDPSIRPIKQRRRVLGPDRNQAISDEVEKFLTTGFIREVYYPDWLANVVMVKKSNGKWRMCVDFTDLNKAYLKDSFPLPRIDQLEKTSFITSKGLFCYKVMPFGLKNAGAIYQRLMNKMFHNQIGRNIEVYIDDMLAKTKDEENHLEDLEETFETLCQYHMKLNPSKCVFGVSSGKFLRFMVSQRGIEANQDKIKAVLEMTPPMTIKEVQSLTGRVAALNRFVSRATDKCLPFFKTLRKAFTWMDECETLYLYLAVSPTAISSTLIREEDGGVGVVFKTPKEHLLKHATRLQYLITNNEAEYEALLTGLRIAKELGATTLKFQSDSQLIVGQVNSAYEVKEDIMAKYLSLVKNSIHGFDEVILIQVPREQNTEADTLAKLASSEEATNQHIEVQYSPSHMEEEVNPMNVNNSWMTPITRYLEEGTLPTDPIEARKLKAEYVMKEVHEGIYGNHSGARSLVHKPVRAGYYWPTMQKDVVSYTRACDKCQRTTARTPTGETPFRLTYGTEAVVPIEIGLTTWRTNHHDESSNDNQPRTNLDLLDEARNQAEAKTRAYQQRMARYYDRRVKHREFKVGDLVLRKITLATKDPAQGKLGPTWEGPYRVVKFHRKGTYHLEKLDGTALPHPWNAEHLKKYYQ
uniref:Uncharacterized protein n=1 Tax=Fagus sylvatica TaxID=28930 RepID=A0A2N9J155_FAGSY